MVPLLCLLYTHLCILFAIRKLIHRRYSLVSKNPKTIPIDVRHRLTDMFTIAESNRLKSLRIDRRFAQATMITVLHYYISLDTVCSMCGFLQMILAMKNIDYPLPPMLADSKCINSKNVCYWTIFCLFSMLCDHRTGVSPYPPQL